MALVKKTRRNYEGTNSTVDLPGRVEVLGAPVDPWTMEQTVEATDALIKEGRFAHLIGVNADKLLQMRDDPEMDACVRRCEIVNADGASMWELCGLAEREGHRVYLLGAKAQVVAKTAEVLSERYPNMVLAGYRDGYFGEDEFDAVVADVEQAEPDIVFVGITSPKKERLIERFRELGAKGAFVGVGGSFDVVSGNIPRAPMWMQRANLEWLFRMMQEPKRLVKRYVVGNTRFYMLLRKESKRSKAND